MFSVTTIMWNKSKESIVNILPGIGICGTFFGIIYALWSIDSLNMKNSIPKLLDGMSIAFITSLIGLGTSLIIRIYIESNSDNVEEENSIDSIVGLLKSNNEQLIILTKTLTSKEDNPILNELQKLRLAMNDKYNELIDEFRTFAKTQAENNANSLIEALEKVMREFNVKISEQFGDNFKRLNEAVGKMLEWQENYYKQIEFIANQLDDNSKLMEKNREIIIDVSEKYSDGIKLSSKMENAIDNLEMQRKSLEGDMERFSNLSIEAEKVFPIIEQNIESLTVSLKESIEKSTSNVENIVEAQQTQLEANIDRLNKIYENSINELNTMQESIIENAKDNLQLMNKGMEKGLNQSLVNFGTQLTGLSEKFVNDYTPLTEKLARVLTIAEETGS
jgi:hypothetical protein